MKKFIKAISGKKALYVVLVLACVCTVLEVITSIRTGNRIDYMAICSIFIAIVAWAEALKSKEIKEKNGNKDNSNSEE